MKKMRKFSAGGTFSPEQEKWLGGADRTDPYILMRMRRAVPDSPAPVEDRVAKPVEVSRDETPDKSYDALESKRLSSPASKPDETPDKSYETSDKSYDTLESKRLSSPTPAPRVNKPDEDAMAVAASKVDRTPAPAAKAPAAKAPATKAPAAKSTQSSGKPGESNMARATAVKPAPAAEPKMERRNLSVPNATGPRSAANPMSKDPSQRNSPAAASTSAPKLKYQSLQDRNAEYANKLKESGVGMYGTTKSEEGPRRGVTKINPEDFKKQPKGMGTLTFAKGGFASSRADGIAQRGKTRGRMC